MTEETIDQTTENNQPSSQNEERDVQAKEEADVVKQAKEQGVSVEEFERTKNALEKANREAMERRHKLKEWDELGVDPEKVKALLEQQAEAERKKKEEEGRYQELIDEMRNQTQSEIERKESEWKQQLQKMQSTVEKHLVDKTIAETLSSEGVKSPKLLSRYMKDYVKTVEGEDGDYKTVVLDDEGNVRTKRGGAAMTVADFVNELKSSDEFASVFPAPKVNGTGSTNDTAKAANNAPSGLRRSQMSLEQKVAYQNQHGFEAYAALPK